MHVIFDVSIYAKRNHHSEQVNEKTRGFNIPVLTIIVISGLRIMEPNSSRSLITTNAPTMFE